MTKVPTAYENALWGWVYTSLGDHVGDIRYADQPYQAAQRDSVTLKVLNVSQEASPVVTMVGTEYLIETAYQGTVSVQCFGSSHFVNAQKLVNSLYNPVVVDANTEAGIEVRKPVSAVQNLTALIGTDFLERSGVDFRFSFREAYRTPAQGEIKLVKDVSRYVELSAQITALPDNPQQVVLINGQGHQVLTALWGETNILYFPKTLIDVGLITHAQIEGEFDVVSAPIVNPRNVNAGQEVRLTITEI